MCVTERERGGGEGGHICWGFGTGQFHLLSGERKKERQRRGGERERDTACLRYTNRVQYQPKILLLTSQYCVSITSVQGLCNITTSVYNYGEIAVCRQGFAQQPARPVATEKQTLHVCHRVLKSNSTK